MGRVGLLLMGMWYGAGIGMDVAHRWGYDRVKGWRLYGWLLLGAVAVVSLIV